MAGKEIITNEAELIKLIGCASAEAAEGKDLPVKITAEHASDIGKIVCDHLTGRKKIPEEDLRLYDLITAGVNLAAVLLGGGSGSPGSVEEEDDGEEKM